MKFRRVAGVLAVAGVTGLSAVLAVSPVGAQTTPSAANDVATVNEDATVLIDVLDNDTPSTGLTIQSVTNPPHGTATIESGQVRYVPDADYNGTDTFAYTVSDGTSTVGGAVTVTVNPVNDAPTATADSASTKADTAKTIDVLANDDDIDNDEDDLTVSIQTAPAHGTATVNGTTQDVTYTPAAGYTGTDVFTYRISDGSLTSNTVAVTIQVKAKDTAPKDLDARVVAACSANPGDARIQGLCGVYLNLDMPPWARAKIGHVIVKLATPKPSASDPVLAVCADEDDSDHIEWLCGIYTNEELPPGIKRLVGLRILDLADDGDQQPISRDDDRKDHKQWKPTSKPWQGWNFDRSSWDNDGHRDKDRDSKDDNSRAESRQQVSFGDDDDDDRKDGRDKDHDRDHGDRRGDRDGHKRGR